MVKSEHYLAEIKHCIEAADIIKLKVLLSAFDKVEAGIGKRLLYELCSADDKLAIAMLGHLIAQHPEIVEETPTIHDVLAGRIATSRELLGEMFASPSNRQLIVYIDIVGDLNMVEAVPHLRGVLNNHKNHQVLKHALRAFGKIGDPSAVGMICEYLYTSDRELLSEAIRALGAIGTAACVQNLYERVGTDQEIDREILDVFAACQDANSIETLCISLSSHHAHLRNHGKLKLRDLGSKAVPALTSHLLRQDDPDWLIHILNLLGEIGDNSAIVPIRKLLQRSPRDPNVRFAAYEALGTLRITVGVYTLTMGLSDPVEHVCIAAARAIDRNFDDLLKSGIQNTLECDPEHAPRLVEAFLVSESGNVFCGLLDCDVFVVNAISYLKEHAHKELRKFYSTLLIKEGRRELADELKTPTREGPSASGLEICTVDDSRMVLKIYRKTLHELGHRSVQFEFPGSAVEYFASHRPDLVITDLNMPEITGLDLTRKIREKYSREELPIIMVTTQNDALDRSSAIEAGVNLFMNKPFTADDICHAINQVNGKDI